MSFVRGSNLDGYDQVGDSSEGSTSSSSSSSKNGFWEEIGDLFDVSQRKLKRWENEGRMDKVEQLAESQAKARVVFAAFLAVFLIIAGVLATTVYNYTNQNSVPAEVESASRSLASISAILGVGMMTWCAYEGIAIDNGRAFSVRNINGIAEWKSLAKTGAEWMLTFTTIGFVITAAALVLEGVYIFGDAGSTLDASQDGYAYGVFYTAVGFTGLALIFWAVLAAAVAGMQDWSAKKNRREEKRRSRK